MSIPNVELTLKVYLISNAFFSRAGLKQLLLYYFRGCITLLQLEYLSKDSY